MSDEKGQRDPHDLKVIDGGKAKSWGYRPDGSRPSGGGGKHTRGLPKASGMASYEKAVAAYVEHPGNHSQASRATGLDPRTCRRFWEIGFTTDKSEVIAPPIKELVAERVRLLQQRSYGELARMHEDEVQQAELRRMKVDAIKEELSATAGARRLVMRVLGAYLRAADLPAAMLEHVLATKFDRSEEIGRGGAPIVTYAAKAGAKIAMGDVWKCANVMALGAARLTQAARVVRQLGIKDRTLDEKVDRLITEASAEILNEQVKALEGSAFARDLAEGRIRFADEPKKG